MCSVETWGYKGEKQPVTLTLDTWDKLDQVRDVKITESF